MWLWLFATLETFTNRSTFLYEHQYHDAAQESNQKSKGCYRDITLACAIFEGGWAKIYVKARKSKG